MTLTRRQRTGYSFVLESLRAGVVGGELHDPSLPMPVQFITNSMAFFDDFTPIDLRDRMTLARLALYLRAVLRADAGDCGMVACPVCGFVGDGSHERGDPCGLCWQRQICPIPRMTWGSTRPLWESAPKTRARAR